MSEAAIISLNAIGAQETHILTSDASDSVFVKDRERHSEFRKYHRSKNVKSPGNPATWPFGERSIKVQYDPRSMGDMLANMWVSLTLPALGNGENYADQVGRHIFKSVTMRVDETEVEVFHGDWGVIFDELYLETSEKVANRFLVNRSLAFDASQTNQEDARYESEVVIPLNFFFSRKYATDEYSSNRPNRPYLPLCAMHRQKLEFDFELHPQTFFANTATTLSLSSFDIITEEITVHPDERLFLSGQRQLLVTDIVRRHPELDIDAGSPKTLKQQLVPSIPVKAFHWFFRDTRFEDPTVVGADGETEEGQLYVHNRFNWSRDTDFDELNTFFNPVLKGARFHINGNPLPDITSSTHAFYKYLVPYQRRLSRPIRNLYTYSFSMSPATVDPSGNLDFSQLKSDRTNIEITLEDAVQNSYTMHMFYTGYQVFEFQGGKMQVA